MKKLRDWWGLLWPILPLLAGLAILLGLGRSCRSAGMRILLVPFSFWRQPGCCCGRSVLPPAPDPPSAF